MILTTITAALMRDLVSFAIDAERWPYDLVVTQAASVVEVQERTKEATRSENSNEGERKMIGRWTAIGVAMISLCCALTVSASGQDASPGGRRIVGGVPAHIQDYEWQVALKITGPDGTPFLCGGSLITRTWVLTAAHCFQQGSIASGTRALSGVDNFPPLGGWLDIKRIIVHPDYTPPDEAAERPPQNDIAMVELAAPDTNPNSDIIPMAGPDTKVAGELEVTGYGITSPNGTSPSQRLMMAYVPYVDNTACNAQRSFHGNVTNAMICAGKTKTDSCTGDSGGPLIMRADDGPVLVGVVSYGISCGKQYKPGIYTRVSFYRDWIASVMQSD